MSFWTKLFASDSLDRIKGVAETESRAWMIQCPSCEFEVSYWELGGVRYGAASRGKKMLRRCKQCGKIKWHRVYKKEPM